MAKRENPLGWLYFLTVILFFLLPKIPLSAQEHNPDSSIKANSRDTLIHVDSFTVKKKFWRASGELLLVELIPWAYNYFVRDADFAHITWESIGHNLQFKNWEWDDNNFKTNQFAHPYHGNLYFSSFRSNGYSFWQSAPAAFAGSYLWEVAGETHPPAPNDFINTSLGGISLGEMTYRLSNHIVNNRQTGFTRQMEEVFAFLVNPLNGFNRILDGRWGRVHYNTKDDTARVPINAIVDLGARRFSTSINDVLEEGDNEFYIRLRLQYGPVYEPVKTPFSSFFVIVEAGAADSAHLNQVYVNGILKQWIMNETVKHRHLGSFTMNYDYFLNNSFEYGGQSFNFKFLSDWNRKSRTRLRTEIGAGPIVLAAVPDDYLYYGEGRNYNYGPGFGVNANVNLDFSNKFVWNINYRSGWFITLNGNDSHFYLNAFSNEFRYNFTSRLSVAMEVGDVTLDGNYENYPDVYKTFPYGRFSFGYRISKF
jgi:hypothetical protein